MKQRVMKLFLAFMVMTGLFGMRTPVRADVNAPIESVDWDFSADKDITITVSEGQSDYLSAVNELYFYCSDGSTFPLSISDSDKTISENTLVISHSAYSPNLNGLTATGVEIRANGYNGYLHGSANTPDDQGGSSDVNAPIESVDWDFSADDDITITVSEGQSDYLSAVNELYFYCSDGSTFPLSISDSDKTISENTLVISHSAYSPNLNGLTATGVEIRADGYNSYLHGSGNTPDDQGGGDISIDPSEINFNLTSGYTPEQATQTVKIKNNGSTDFVNLNIRINLPEFTAQPSENIAVAANEEVEIAVTFTPNGGGSSNGALDVYEGDSYITQAQLSGNYDDRPRACRIEMPETTDPANYKYTVTCSSVEFDNLPTSTTYTLILDDGTGAGPINVRGFSGHEFTPNRDGFTFTTEDVRKSGVHVDKNNYAVEFSVHTQDGTKRYLLSEATEIPFLEVNPLAPELRADSIHEEGGANNGVIVSCEGSMNESDACYTYLKYVTDHQTDGTGPLLQKDNSGIKLDPTASGRVFLFPAAYRKEEGGTPDENLLKIIPCGENRIGILIKEEEMLRQGMEPTSVTGISYEVYVNALTAYAVAGPLGPVEIKVETKDVNVSAYYDNDNEVLQIHADSEDFLKGITNLTFRNTDIPGSKDSGIVVKNYTVEPDPTQRNYYVAYVPVAEFGQCLTGAGTGTFELTVSSSGYGQKKMPISILKNPYKEMPRDIQIRIIAEGISIRRTGGSDPEQAIKGIYDSALNNKYAPAVNINKCTIVNGMVNYGPPGTDEDLHITKSAHPFELTNNDSRILIRLNYSDLVKEFSIKNPSRGYHMHMYDPLYGTSATSADVQTLAPLRLYEAAKAGTTLTPEQLAELDKVASEQVSNVAISAEETDESGMNVTILGEVSAAVTSNQSGEADPEDLNYDGNDEKSIAVETAITKPTASEESVISNYEAQNGLQGTDVKFTVTIVKNSTVTGREYHVSMLPYEASMEFDLPTEPAPVGYHYVLLREHTEPDGTVVVEPIQWQNGSNGQGVAFTKKFSTFAMAIEKDKTDPVTPDAEPAAPESGSSRKESSEPVKTDNVVTCQMAGNPAGYAWNEAAKACQPGFIDNAGVFHSAAVRRTGVPNTYDKGLKGSIFSLMTSIIVGISAAWALRNY